MLGDGEILQEQEADNSEYQNNQQAAHVEPYASGPPRDSLILAQFLGGFAQNRQEDDGRNADRKSPQADVADILDDRGRDSGHDGRDPIQTEECGDLDDDEVECDGGDHCQTDGNGDQVEQKAEPQHSE